MMGEMEKVIRFKDVAIGLDPGPPEPVMVIVKKLPDGRLEVLKQYTQLDADHPSAPS